MNQETVNQDDMFRVTRRYTFSASHRLHAIELSDAANRALYGKCNNAYGHGHNYTVEVSVRGPLDPVTGRAVDTAALDRLVRRHVVEPFDHHNLNSEVPVFAATVPTSENLGLEICRRLKRNWEATFPNRWPVLEKIRIGETPRNIFEVGAHEIE